MILMKKQIVDVFHGMINDVTDNEFNGITSVIDNNDIYISDILSNAIN